MGKKGMVSPDAVYGCQYLSCAITDKEVLLSFTLAFVQANVVSSYNIALRVFTMAFVA
jgi:hypothetical protein